MSPWLLRAAAAALALASAGPVQAAASGASAELFGEGVISTPQFETSGTLSPDGREFYFTKGAPDFGQFFFTIVVSRFDKGRWSTPQVAPFSGRYADTSPFLSPDGRKLIFSSNRPVDGAAKGRADFDLWMVERKGDGWGEPRPLKELNTTGWEMHSAMTRDGALYFGAIRDDNYDIWRARWNGSAYGPAERLGEPVNTKEVEYDPYIDPDGRYLIFGSTGHKPNLGGADLYVSFNRGGAWTAPQNLGPKVNTPGREAGGFVARWNGRAYLVFNSETGRTLGAPMRPDHRMSYAELSAILDSPDNQVRNFYRIELDALGIDGLD